MALTPNMLLTLPDPSSTGGPLWAQELNTAFQTIDSHNHAANSGVQITPAGLNINADLTFQSNRALSLLVARFSSQSSVFSSLSDKNQLYVVGGELYYQDGSGTNVQLTSGGSLNIAGVGGITGLSGTTAALTYSNTLKTFIFTQAANTSAKLDAASITIRDTAVSVNGITIKSPVSLAGNYMLTLPAALPGTNYALSLTDTSGVQTYLGLGSANQVPVVNSGGTALAYALLTGSNVASNINLPGSAVQENGKNVVVSNTNATNSLAIVRGGVTSGGAVSWGEGFSVVRNSLGNYTVTFTTAFGDKPALSVLPGGVFSIHRYNSISTTTFNLDFANNTLSTNVDTEFSFIAIGQRA